MYRQRVEPIPIGNRVGAKLPRILEGLRVKFDVDTRGALGAGRGGAEGSIRQFAAIRPLMQTRLDSSCDRLDGSR